MASPEDPIVWARRVNRRWIVHHGLEKSAEAYLSHLEAVDGERLRHSCQRAHQLVHECGMTEDPKPWFYAGLFSLAAPDEATRFLQGHWFTAACIPSGAAMPAAASKDLADETQDKLHRIREALARLPQPK